MSNQKEDPSTRWKRKNPDKVKSYWEQYKLTQSYKDSRIRSSEQRRKYRIGYFKELKLDPVRYEKYIKYHRAWQRSRRLEIQRKQNERNRNRKLDLISHFGGKCSKCGYSKCSAALDFHHIDPSIKETTVAHITNLALAKNEADKCILLCSNCHREEHASNPMSGLGRHCIIS